VSQKPFIDNAGSPRHEMFKMVNVNFSLSLFDVGQVDGLSGVPEF